MPTPKIPETLYAPYAQYKPQGSDGTAAKFMNSVLTPPNSVDPITPISAATNGTFTFIVSPEYTAYYNTKYNGDMRSLPDSLDGNIRQVIYANGSFFFLKADSHTILQFEKTGTTIDVTPVFNMKQSEHIVYFAGGMGGIIMMTNVSTKWYHYDYSKSMYLCETVPVSDAQFEFTEVKRLEMDYVPVFYLLNGTVVTYGSINGSDYGCVKRITGSNFRVVVKTHIDRFIPQFKVIASSATRVSGYLYNKKFYECSSTTPTESLVYPDEYEDIYVKKDLCMYINATNTFLN